MSPTVNPATIRVVAGDSNDYVGEGAAQQALATVMREIRGRRQVGATRALKRLAPDDYHAVCGAMGELEYLEDFIVATLKKRIRAEDSSGSDGK